MDAHRFRDHVVGTYFTLRLSLGLSALGLPLALWLGGWILFGTTLQPSMSAYYYTHMGDVFLGVLIAVGASLTIYRGYSGQEDWILDAAGVLAVGVALIPAETGTPLGGSHALITSSLLHGVCAIGFFFAIGWVCIFRAQDTLELISDGIVVRRFKRSYRIIGVLMIAAPIAATVLNLMAGSRLVVFWSEALAAWVFAAYWLTKTYELWRSGGDRIMLIATR
jgi:hypothetical protein